MHSWKGELEGGWSAATQVVPVWVRQVAVNPKAASVSGEGHIISGLGCLDSGLDPEIRASCWGLFPKSVSRAKGHHLGHHLL